MQICAWVKDRKHKYLKCSERFAQLAGLDSAHAIAGKRDQDLIWKNAANDIYKEDVMVLAGLSVKNAHHTRLTFQGPKSVLINKQHEKNWLVGTAMDISGQVLMEQNGQWNMQTRNFEVNGIQLTPKEIEVVRLLLIGQSSKLMAAKLAISIKTIEQRIESLRRKFNAGSKVALAQILHRIGLTYLATHKDQYMV